MNTTTAKLSQISSFAFNVAQGVGTRLANATQAFKNVFAVDESSEDVH
jgi:hypothetical protein